MENWILRHLGFITIVPALVLSTFFLQYSPLGYSRTHVSSSTTSAPASSPSTQPVAAETPAPTTFDQAVDQARTSGKSIYLEFSATWCGPCKMFQREVLSSDQGKEALKKVVYLPVDVDENKALAERFNVSGVPTGILIKPEKKGSEVKEIGRHVGTLSLAEFVDFLAKK